MNSELVSVIIPTYNRSDFLKEAIESVLAQTYENFELLILDNCSPDHTPDVVAGFKDPRIKYLRHQCNIGATANWAYGVHWAQGKYLSILCDDDIYGEDFLLNRMKIFSELSDIIAVTGAFRCCNESGNIIRNSKVPSDCIKVFKKIELFKFALTITGEWFYGASLYKLDTVRKVWDRLMMGGKTGDYLLNISLSLLEDAALVFIPKSDIIYRFHPDQDSSKNRLKVAECGAMLAMQIWEFELSYQGNIYKNVAKCKLSKEVSHYARMLYDLGYICESRKMFVRELLINHYTVKTWFRLFRTLLKRNIKSNLCNYLRYNENINNQNG